MFVQDLGFFIRPELFRRVEKVPFTVTVLLLPDRKIRAAFDRPVVSSVENPFITYIGDKENCYAMNTYYLDALYNIKIDQLISKLTFSAERASSTCKLPVDSLDTYKKLRTKMASWDEFFVRGFEQGKAIKFVVPAKGVSWALSIPHQVQFKFGDYLGNGISSKVQGYGDFLICEDSNGVLNTSSMRLIRATEFAACYDTRGYSIVTAENVNKQILDLLK